MTITTFLNTTREFEHHSRFCKHWLFALLWNQNQCSIWWSLDYCKYFVILGHSFCTYYHKMCKERETAAR